MRLPHMSLLCVFVMCVLSTACEKDYYIDVINGTSSEFEYLYFENSIERKWYEHDLEEALQPGETIHIFLEHTDSPTYNFRAIGVDNYYYEELDIQADEQSSITIETSLGEGDGTGDDMWTWGPNGKP